MRLQKREREELNKQRAEALRQTFDDPSVSRIIVDCSFGALMDDFERNSLALQLQQCYSHLRTWGKGRAQMHVCSIDDELESKIRNRGGDQWVIHLHKKAIESVIHELGNSRVIVMSPDATEEITVNDLSSTQPTVFIIGGIVDRRVSRNETSHKAIRLGLESRRLPVDSTRFVNKVFNIDSVFAFIIRATGERIDGREGLIKLMEETMPERKKTRQEPDKVLRSKETKIVSQTDPSNTIKLDRYTILDLFSR
jgi:ribosome biogenesis SPOUT family RNA methylase Rps3